MNFFSADLKSLQDLYIQHLQKALDLENTIVEKGLPGLIAHATDHALIAGLEAHLEESRTHAHRVSTILDRHTDGASSTKCLAIHALVAEGVDGIKDAGSVAIRDITIIAAAQEVEHHEIAVYGTLASWAQILGHVEDVALLTRTLEEEKAADKKLSVVSDSVNVEAELVNA